jgi:hypothetical protein
MTTTSGICTLLSGIQVGHNLVRLQQPSRWCLALATASANGSMLGCSEWVPAVEASMPEAAFQLLMICCGCCLLAQVKNATVEASVNQLY